MNTSKTLLIAGFVLLLGAMSYLGWHIHELSERQKIVKEDFSTINDISFGLLSVNSWKSKIEEIVEEQIDNFNFTSKQQKDLQIEIEKILHALIDKAVKMINKPQKSIGGKIRKVAFNTFIDEEELHKEVPGFAKTIVDQVKKPSSKRRLKNLAQEKLDDLEKTTFDSSITVQVATTKKIFSKYGVKSEQDFEKKTDTILDGIRRENYACTAGMLGCVLLVLLGWRLCWKKPETYNLLFVLSVIAAGILLLVGVTSAMIDVEARISTLEFRLLGKSLEFKNQILFFQSKSILDVVIILVRTGKFDSVIVGSLIFCFSVLFPISKLTSGLIYLTGKRGWTKGRFIHYFAFNSGKWSMADVMVVAIMMTYFGFNGILDSQLKSLNINTDNLSSITTNNTSLQPGYMLFVLFVLFGLVLSEILKRITKNPDQQPPLKPGAQKSVIHG
ncbi:MAG: paraquat-inducible protein A [Mucilaginibacter polytrichastri]|nr:paraquat-inducible protein A [Mucilaginibacter polytrichastri]